MAPSNRFVTMREVPRLAAGKRLIEVRNLEYEYPGGGFRLCVPALDVSTGDRLAVIGPSGSGKTTLLNVLTGIVEPTKGSLEVDGFRLDRISEKDRQDLRLLRLGLVFQEFELLDHLDALDNVLLPYRLSPDLTLDAVVRDRARSLLREVALDKEVRRHPRRLSHGERQRIAVCRALITSPAIVFADEPTGNLDTDNRDRITDILFRYTYETRAPLVIVSHDPAIVGRCGRSLDMAEAI